MWSLLKTVITRTLSLYVPKHAIHGYFVRHKSRLRFSSLSAFSPQMASSLDLAIFAWIKVESFGVPMNYGMLLLTQGMTLNQLVPIPHPRMEKSNVPMAPSVLWYDVCSTVLAYIHVSGLPHWFTLSISRTASITRPCVRRPMKIGQVINLVWPTFVLLAPWSPQKKRVSDLPRLTVIPLTVFS
jgi:hypothetical protein